MAGTYSPYLECRDTGNTLLGYAPGHWQLTRVKYVAEITPKKPLVDRSLDCSFIPMEKLKTDSIVLDEIKQIDAVYYGYTYFADGDILMAKVTPCFENKNIAIAQGLINKIGFGSSEIYTTRASKKVGNRFLFYRLQEDGFMDLAIGAMTGAGGLRRVPSETVANYIYASPGYGEQQKIANFLDHETAKIDTLIHKQQQLITLLKEKRQAVINNAVTKGLNPNAPMRDSGVEWLGEVPEHWEVSNMDYVLNDIGDVDHYMPQSIEEGIPYVMTGDLKELASSINFEKCKQVSHRDYLKLSNKIQSSRGDVIMARYATIGTASYIDVDIDFLVSYSCVTIKPDLSKVLGLYLFYYFKSDAFLQGIQSQVNTNTQGNVGVNDLKKIKVALPGITEQSAIIEYLQLKLGKLNSISTRSQSAIDLMQERRTALISAAVTGKIDVRNWKAV
jgi:type I restriction enzyme S subunit